MNLFLAITISYLIGAIPFSFVITKLFKHKDLRALGSGNVGATNAFRNFGPAIGIPALILDIAKGAIPVTLIATATYDHSQLPISSIRLILGIVSICGHNWTIFLKFKGGKGIATSLGVLLGLASTSLALAKVLGILVLLWTAVLLASGYVSLASIICAICMPIFLIIFKFSLDYVLFGILIGCFAVYRHKSNIRRILQKKESRFNILSRLHFPRKKPLS